MFDIRKIKTSIETAIHSAISSRQLIELYNRVLAIRKNRVNMKVTLCSAITSRRLVEFRYHGGFRLVEPFCLGEVVPGSKESLLCYQVSGYTQFGDPVGWKLYRFSEISRLKVTDENFTGAGRGYDPDDLRMTTIDCRISITADDESKPKETIEPAQTGREEDLSNEESEHHAIPSQKHSEQMRGFRRSHSTLPSHLSDNHN